MNDVVARILAVDAANPQKQFFQDRAAFERQVKELEPFFKDNPIGYELDTELTDETEEVRVDVLIEAFGNESMALPGMEKIQFDQNGFGTLDGIPVVLVGQAKTGKGQVTHTVKNVKAATPRLVEMIEQWQSVENFDSSIREALTPLIVNRFEGLRGDLLKDFTYDQFMQHLGPSGTQDWLIRIGSAEAFQAYLRQHPSEDAAEQEKITQLTEYLDTLIQRPGPSPMARTLPASPAGGREEPDVSRFGPDTGDPDTPLGHEGLRFEARDDQLPQTAQEQWLAEDIAGIREFIEQHRGHPKIILIGGSAANVGKTRLFEDLRKSQPGGPEGLLDIGLQHPDFQSFTQTKTIEDVLEYSQELADSPAREHKIIPQILRYVSGGDAAVMRTWGLSR